MPPPTLEFCQLDSLMCNVCHSISKCTICLDLGLNVIWKAQLVEGEVETMTDVVQDKTQDGRIGPYGNMEPLLQDKVQGGAAGGRVVVEHNKQQCSLKV